MPRAPSQTAAPAAARASAPAPAPAAARASAPAPAPAAARAPAPVPVPRLVARWRARVIDRAAIALSIRVMAYDNAVDRVTQALRSETAGLAPGDRLPSVRDLMARHRVSPLTVQRAIARLAGEGLV